MTDTAGTLIYNSSLPIKFLILSDPPVQTDYNPMEARVPYDSRMARVGIYKKGSLLAAKDIDLCNNDGVCETDYETTISCPSDCPPGTKDGICVKDKDGVCDPDCYAGVDPDCANQGIYGTLPYLLIALIVLCVVVLFLWKRKKGK